MKQLRTITTKVDKDRGKKEIQTIQYQFFLSEIPWIPQVVEILKAT